MRLLASIDIPEWMLPYIDDFLDLMDGAVYELELLDVAFKRRLNIDHPLLGAEEHLYERIYGIIGCHDSPTLQTFCEIVDVLQRGICIDRRHREVLKPYNERCYEVTRFYDNTLEITLDENPKEDES